VIGTLAQRGSQQRAAKFFRCFAIMVQLVCHLHQHPSLPSHLLPCCCQTLLHTRDVDPYYKLALLSYRSKLQNAELLQVGWDSDDHCCDGSEW